MSYHGFGVVTSDAGISFTTRSGYTSPGGSTTTSIVAPEAGYDPIEQTAVPMTLAVRRADDVASLIDSRAIEPMFDAPVQTIAQYKSECAAAGGIIGIDGKCTAGGSARIGGSFTMQQTGPGGALLPGGGGGGGGGGSDGELVCPASAPVNVIENGIVVGCCPSGYVGSSATGCVKSGSQPGYPPPGGGYPPLDVSGCAAGYVRNPITGLCSPVSVPPAQGDSSMMLIGVAAIAALFLLK